MAETQGERLYKLMNDILNRRGVTLEQLCMDLLEEKETKQKELDVWIDSYEQEKTEKEAAQAEYQKLHGMFMDLEAKAVATETENGKLDTQLTHMSNMKDHYQAEAERTFEALEGLQETLTYLKRRWAVAEDDIKSYQDTIYVQHNEKRILTEAVNQLSQEALSSNTAVRFPSGIEDVREILSDVPDTWINGHTYGSEQNG